MCNRMYLFQILLFLYLVQEITSYFEFTNIKCRSEDTKFSEFEPCQLKSVNRTYKFAHVKVKMYQTPVTKVKVNLAVFKRFNGYRPLMYNITFDACRFLSNSNPIQSDLVINFFHDLLKNTSNMNHPCPFDHDLELKMPISLVKEQFTKVLPFPGGDYMVDTTWFAYDKSVPRSNFMAHFTKFNLILIFD